MSLSSVGGFSSCLVRAVPCGFKEQGAHSHTELPLSQWPLGSVLFVYFLPLPPLLPAPCLLLCPPQTLLPLKRRLGLPGISTNQGISVMKHNVRGGEYLVGPWQGDLLTNSPSNRSAIKRVFWGKGRKRRPGEGVEADRAEP